MSDQPVELILGGLVARASIRACAGRTLGPWASLSRSRGDTCAPAAVYFGEIWVPSGNDVDVSRIRRRGWLAAPPRCPPPAGACGLPPPATITQRGGDCRPNRANP